MSLTKNLINWSELSRHMTGNRGNIRPGKVPYRYKKRIQKLVEAVHEWKLEDEKEQTKEEIESLI